MRTLSSSTVEQTGDQVQNHVSTMLNTIEARIGKTQVTPWPSMRSVRQLGQPGATGKQPYDPPVTARTRPAMIKHLPIASKQSKPGLAFRRGAPPPVGSELWSALEKTMLVSSVPRLSGNQAPTGPA